MGEYHVILCESSIKLEIECDQNIGDKVLDCVTKKLYSLTEDGWKLDCNLCIVCDENFNLIAGTMTSGATGNTKYGCGAGENNATGSNNVFIGRQAGENTTNSGAVAVYAELKTNSQLYLIYKNENTFTKDEPIEFSESGYTAFVSSVNVGDKNIVSDFILDNGQRKQFYDFGRIIRKNNSKIPSSRLKIYFDYFGFDSNDYGDIMTTSSFPQKKVIQT